MWTVLNYERERGGERFNRRGKRRRVSHTGLYQKYSFMNYCYGLWIFINRSDLLEWNGMVMINDLFPLHMNVNLKE